MTGRGRGSARACLPVAFVAASVSVAAVVCVAPTSGQAGGAGRHRFGLEAGKLWQGIEDALASPSRYEGQAAVVGASYRFRGETWRLGASVAWARPRMTTAPRPRPTYEEATAASLDSWVLRRVWRSTGGRWAAFVGPAVAGDMGLRRHYYRLDQSISYDNAFLGLEAAALLEWDAAGLGRIAGRVMLPVAGVSVRTPYTTLAGSGPEVRVGVPPSFVLLRHRLDLRNPVGDRLVFGFLYEGTLVRHSEPLDLGVAWHRLGVVLEYGWGKR